MTDNEFTMPITVQEAERRARELRAQAARDGITSLGRALRRVVAGLFSGHGKSAHA